MNKKLKRTGIAVAGLCLAAIFGSAAKDAWTMHSLAAPDPAGRPMTAGEIAMSRPIFGDDLDYAAVRLHEAPDLGDDARTKGNDVYLEAAGLHHADLSAADVALADKKNFEHELTHVWQNQHRNWLARLRIALREEPAFIFNTLAGGHAGYGYDINSKTSFDAMGTEQQGQVVGDYFKARTLAERAGCGTAAHANEPVCVDLNNTVAKYERKLKPALPLPGALTFRPAR